VAHASAKICAPVFVVKQFSSVTRDWTRLLACCLEDTERAVVASGRRMRVAISLMFEVSGNTRRAVCDVCVCVRCEMLRCCNTAVSSSLEASLV